MNETSRVIGVSRDGWLVMWRDPGGRWRNDLATTPTGLRRMLEAHGGSRTEVNVHSLGAPPEAVVKTSSFTG